jgi:hypothetical protein
MRRINYLLPVLIIFILVAVAVVWQTDQLPDPAVRSDGPQLKVSPEGSMINTNVEDGSLQPAAAPENSATSSDTNPQQAVPNYCLPGEQPIVDGCVAQ